MQDVETLDVKGIHQDVLGLLAQDLTSMIPAIQHVDILQHDEQTELGVVVKEEATIEETMYEEYIPGFDMRWKKEFVKSLGRVAGNLLGGEKARLSKKDTWYNIIPLDASYDARKSLRQDSNPVFSFLADMADRRGLAATVSAAHEMGLNEAEVFQWQQMYTNEQASSAHPVIFRTVSDENPGSSWMFPPRTEYYFTTQKISSFETRASLITSLDRFFRGEAL